MKFRILLFAGLLGGLGQAQAFFDDEAHNQLRLVRERMSSLDATSKRQADTNEQQGREIVDLREQVDAEKSKFKALLSQYETLNNVLNSTQQIIESRNAEHRTYIQDLKAQLVSLGEKRSAATQELGEFPKLVVGDGLVNRYLEDVPVNEIEGVPTFAGSVPQLLRSAFRAYADGVEKLLIGDVKTRCAQGASKLMGSIGDLSGDTC